MWMKARGNSILKSIDAGEAQTAQSVHLSEHEYLFNGVNVKSLGLQTAVALARTGKTLTAPRSLNLAAFGAGYGLVELDLALADARMGGARG